jgi:hypothetical protein
MDGVTLWADRQADRQTGRQASRQTGRQACKRMMCVCTYVAHHVCRTKYKCCHHSFLLVLDIGYLALSRPSAHIHILHLFSPFGHLGIWA